MDARVGWVGLGGVLVLAACNAILGIEEATLEPVGPPAGGQGGQGAAGGQAGQGGAIPECTSAIECDDENPCTLDECDDVTHECTRTNVPNGPAPAELQTPGDCRNAVCNGGSVTNQLDDTDLPDDGQSCTDDLCTSGTPSNPPVANGTTCTEDGGKVCYGGDCVDCYANQHCTSPDTCGGAGTPLECGCEPVVCTELSCGWGTDTKCDTGTLNCSNATMDGDETDVDCGGPTVSNGGTCNNRCSNGRHCVNPNGIDCASGVCNCGICGPDGCAVGGSGGTGGSGGSGGTGGS